MSFLAFTKKEITEYIRTSKILIMAAVSVFLGILSPATAKYTPQIFEAMDMDAAALGLANPTAFDSWIQFFKNMGQIGLIVTVIILCGITAGEFSKGTLINLLTKGLNRSTVILSKLFSSALLWTGSYLIALGICYGYTEYYFKDNNLSNAFIAFASLWLYGMLLISLLILGGIIFKNVLGRLLLVGGTAIILSTINIIPDFVKYNPASLASENLLLLKNEMTVSDIAPAIIICAFLTIVSVISAILIFNKKEI